MVERESYLQVIHFADLTVDFEGKIGRLGEAPSTNIDTKRPYSSDGKLCFHIAIFWNLICATKLPLDDLILIPLLYDCGLDWSHHSGC